MESHNSKEEIFNIFNEVILEISNTEKYQHKGFPYIEIHKVLHNR